MEVIVLAGGFGTRLRPLTEDRAKPLLPILDQPLLQRVVEVVPSEMIDRVIVAAGFGIEEMRDWATNAELPYEVVLSVEDEAMGTGGAIALAREHLSGEGPVLVLNGDLVSSVEVESLLKHHKTTGALATLSLWEVEDPSRFGVVELKNGEILQFQEKPKKGSELSNLINAGTYLLEPEILEMIPPNQKISVERDIYPKVAGNGLHGFPFEGYFIDSGTPESYLEANFKAIGNNGTASHAGANMRGKSIVHESAKLEDCIIGPNAIIGPNVEMKKCVIRKSVILANVKGYGGIVEKSIIGPNISFKNDLNRTLISPEGTITF